MIPENYMSVYTLFLFHLAHYVNGSPTTNALILQNKIAHAFHKVVFQLPAPFSVKPFRMQKICLQKWVNN